MKTFKEFLQIKEGGNLWANPGAQDNPSNPGTKRKNPKHPYNHRFGDAMGGGSPMASPTNVTPQPKAR